MILKILIKIWQFFFILDILGFFFSVKKCAKYLNDFFNARNVDVTIINNGNSIWTLVQMVLVSAIPILNISMAYMWVFNYDDFVKSVLINVNDKLNKTGIITDELKEEFYNKVERDFN